MFPRHFSVRPLGQNQPLQNPLFLSSSPGELPLSKMPASPPQAPRRSPAFRRRDEPLCWIALAPEPLANSSSGSVKPWAIAQTAEATAIVKSAGSQLAPVLDQLRCTEIEFPAATSGFYIDLAAGEYRLRLYALVWTEEVLEDSAVSLLLALGPTAGSYLPIGTTLTVKEQNLLSTEAHLRWMSHPTYVYTQVFGGWEEPFTVEVALPNAHPLELPALYFVPTYCSGNV